MHPDDLKTYQNETFPQYITAKDNQEIVSQYRMKHKNGDWRWLVSHETIYSRLPNGKPYQIFGMIHDITESKNTEFALRTSEATYRILAENSNDMITRHHPDGRYAYVSPSCKSILGYEPQELIGVNPYTLFHPDDSAAIQKNHTTVIKEAAVDLISYRIKCKDGTYCWLETNNKTLTHPDSGEVLEIICISRDITERKQAETERAKLDFQINQMQKLESLGVLAGGIAHDFNNLLGGIFGYLDMANEVSTEKQVKSYLAKTLGTIDRARALTQQLLTFAKGGAPIKTIAHLVPFIQETAQFALSGSSISCQFDCAHDLWPANFDKNQIGQVIDNIVINAQQAMPSGGTLCITLHNQTFTPNEHIILMAGDYVKISIRDQGIGIPTEFIGRIFDPFYSTKPKCHGLGLATSHSIIHKHSGAIDVCSEPGKGSTFTVYIPASKKSAIASVQNVQTQHQGSGIFLLMDDEKVIQETIGSMLTSFGYTVVIKEHGQEAIDYFVEQTNKENVAGMIFDLTIPGKMGGRDAIVEIRKISQSVPVFVASGYASDPIIANPGNYGFTASLCKPFRKAELTDLLNRHILQHIKGINLP